jgi:hypothetical protein
MERDLSSSVSPNAQGNLLKTLTSMNTKDLIVDDNTQSEKVEHVCEVVPHVGVPVFPRAFRIKSVRLGDTS